MEALKCALHEGFGRDPIFMRDGGSIPIVNMMQKEFDTPILMAGFARPDCGAHGPNEYFSLTDFERAIRSSALLFSELGRVEN